MHDETLPDQYVFISRLCQRIKSCQLLPLIENEVVKRCASLCEVLFPCQLKSISWSILPWIGWRISISTSSFSTDSIGSVTFGSHVLGDVGHGRSWQVSKSRNANCSSWRIWESEKCDGNRFIHVFGDESRFETAGLNALLLSPAVHQQIIHDNTVNTFVIRDTTVTLSEFSKLLSLVVDGSI
jgi:hypothetical protein